MSEAEFGGPPARRPLGAYLKERVVMPEWMLYSSLFLMAGLIVGLTTLRGFKPLLTLFVVATIAAAVLVFWLFIKKFGAKTPEARAEARANATMPRWFIVIFLIANLFLIMLFTSLYILVQLAGL